MCRAYQFLHICGHVHRNTVIPCQEFSSLPPQVGPAYPECPELMPMLRLLPSLCEECKAISILSDWLKQTPEERFAIMQQWAQMKRDDLAVLGALKQKVDTSVGEEEEKGTPDQCGKESSSSDASKSDSSEVAE